MGTDRTADRLDIAETLSRYAWAMCDRDWDTWLAAFTPDGHVDYTTAGGIAGTAAEGAEWLSNTFTMFEVTVSHGGNVVIDFTGDDEAKVRSIYVMVMKIGGDTPTFMQASGYYNDVFVRTDGGWKIKDRFEQLLYMR